MEKDLILLSDKELSQRMVNYLDEIEQMVNEVCNFLDRKTSTIDIKTLRMRYKTLKENIKNDDHELSLSRNRRKGSDLIQHFYTPSLQGASAYGFGSPTNCTVDHKLFSSLEEARYRLRKYKSYDDWKRIAES